MLEETPYTYSVQKGDTNIVFPFSFYCYDLYYIAYAGLTTAVRLKVRRMARINGNVFEDFFASLFFYPNVAVQIEETIQVMLSKDKNVICNEGSQNV